VNQALALDPTSDSAWDTLAELAVRAGDREGARRAWREAARHSPARRARYEARLKALDGMPDAPP
jgi:cytochrome c-type biogenesis protein CcmH/NrfG